MNTPMQCFQNALGYFDSVVSNARKMFMKLAPDYLAGATTSREH
jgi:hypothetical protein